ncbi:MAG: zinc transporter ZupT [Duncaniella sp.]|nr:zinc transporter ZupT [Duncaniella sp.]
MHLPDIDNFVAAILLTLLAGLSTGLGALVAFTTKADNKRVLSFALGLSAGVMVYISFMELLPEALTGLRVTLGENAGGWYGMLAFFGGIAFIALIDWLVPEEQNPHEYHPTDSLSAPVDATHRLRRQGLMLALAIGIHNFPEGMATFVSALDGWTIALPIVIAIAIHNIPEGIAVSVPIYHATGKRSKALRYAVISGLAEPVGALIGGAILLPFWSPTVSGAVLAAVAGVMVYISFDELLPSAHSNGHHHLAVSGVIAGMAVMAVSLMLL